MWTRIQSWPAEGSIKAFLMPTANKASDCGSWLQPRWTRYEVKNKVREVPGSLGSRKREAPDRRSNQQNSLQLSHLQHNVSLLTLMLAGESGQAVLTAVVQVMLTCFSPRCDWFKRKHDQRWRLLVNHFFLWRTSVTKKTLNLCFSTFCSLAKQLIHDTAALPCQVQATHHCRSKSRKPRTRS